MHSVRFLPRQLLRLAFALMPVAGLLVAECRVFSATYFLSPNGSDASLGTSNSPFLTITKAQSTAATGDIVYLRGGTYFLNNSNLTTTNNPWAIVNNINKNGVSYLAYPGETPVFNFSNVQPADYRVTAFLVSAKNCVFRGFEVVGVQVTIQTNHTQSECFRITGSSNLFQQLKMHDGMGIGWYLTAGSSNLVLNCDAYNNRGLDSGSIGNIDGFGCHPSSGGKGNLFRGCRAWFNSDDGYDCINAFESVSFDHCWSFYNGYATNFVNLGGDGNGIKGGGYGAAGGPIPNPVPRHLIEFCLTVRNKASGFYSNHHVGGSDWYNNTAYRNATDFNMLSVLSDNSNSVPGYGHVMKNNLGYKGSTEVANLGPTNDTTFNSFTLPVTVATNDFYTLDESQLMAPRQADGSLPVIAFARLVPGSDLIDKGTNAGFPFLGAAPDLGAFEYGSANVLPTFGVGRIGTNLIFTGTSGWPNGTNYLITTTNLPLASAQWTRVATNKFNVTGSYIITNGIPAGLARRFYQLNVIP